MAHAYNALGTRSRQNFRQEHPSSRLGSRSYTRDVGMTKRVVTTATFTASNSRITGSNGDFANFAVGDTIAIKGTLLNNGDRVVTGLDGTNQAYLVLDFPPKDEGPVSSTEVRST